MNIEKNSINNKIMVIGALPPPMHGLSVANEMLIKSDLKNKYEFIVINTAKPIENNGELRFGALLKDVMNIFNFISKLIFCNPRCVYITISQSKFGFLRDSIYIYISKLLSKKVILHLHGAYFRKLYDSESDFFKNVVKKSCNISDDIIVLSSKFKYIFEGIVNESKIKVVSNGIPINYISDNEFIDALRSKQNRDSIRVLYLSNLIKSKGYFDLIQSISYLSKKINIEFIFAGAWSNDKEKNDVMQFIIDNKLETLIEFKGVVKDKEKKDLLLNSDLFILPTYYPNEGQPISIIEAMAAGLPIISTDTGCITDMVIDGYNGFIVEKQKPEEIAEKIMILANKKELLLNMSNNSRKLYLKNNTSDAFIDGLESIFKQYLKR
ncbi:glycosyltransferase family 4 protein [Thermoanaerobacterium thermosaccharolyticum]|uniref:Glycosyltransferase n=1 Tax=Thermoanaerobacterium thermosaccharolyticum M0795 TaxID=698948 RepID=L0IJW7_THETR|nr:glycosyltransferase family 4 protein [Thermoanaerobacterium thermosaccharolyticum]AGB18536.1 glycosyltransferase [Thermoanaerobacterium thermosaccharolyticum M0795]